MNQLLNLKNKEPMRKINNVVSYLDCGILYTQREKFYAQVVFLKEP
jgi:hypothetical protein